MATTTVDQNVRLPKKDALPALLQTAQKQLALQRAVLSNLMEKMSAAPAALNSGASIIRAVRFAVEVIRASAGALIRKRENVIPALV